MLVLEEAAYCDEGFFYEVTFRAVLLILMNLVSIAGGGGICSGQ